MASEREPAEAQAQAITAAQAAAQKRAAVPLWYWLGTGAGISFVIFAVTSGDLALRLAATLTICGGYPLISLVLRRVRGIRVASVIGDAEWLMWPTAILLGGVAILTFTVVKNSGQWWPGILTASIAILITVAFGIGVDRVRRHPEDMDG